MYPPSLTDYNHYRIKEEICSMISFIDYNWILSDLEVILSFRFHADKYTVENIIGSFPYAK